MRTRAEIEKQKEYNIKLISNYNKGIFGEKSPLLVSRLIAVLNEIQVEVLLDIRDLLSATKEI